MSRSGEVGEQMTSVSDDFYVVPPIPSIEPLSTDSKATDNDLDKTSPQISSKKHKERALEELLKDDLAPDELRASLIHSITEFERLFRRQYPLIWGATLIGPVLLTVTLLVLMGLGQGWDLPRNYLWGSLATFFVFGRFVILVGQDGQTIAEASSWFSELSLTPEQLFGLVTYMDVLIALFVTFHMGYLFRIPWLGQKIAGLASDGKFIMEQQPWLRRLAFFALVGFVIFPTSTTGSIGGSIFGRLLGLGRFRTVLGVVCGSLLGNALMYFFAKEINEWIGPDSFWLKMSGVLLLVIGVMFIELKYRKAKNRYLEDQQHRKSTDQD